MAGSPRLKSLARVDFLILDDWGLEPLDGNARHHLLEILEDRYGQRSTLVTSELPVANWHLLINDPTYADAILDRLVHNAHRIEMSGDSLRRPTAPVAALPTRKHDDILPNDQVLHLRAIKSERCAASDRNTCAPSSESALALYSTLAQGHGNITITGGDSATERVPEDVGITFRVPPPELRLLACHQSPQPFADGLSPFTSPINQPCLRLTGCWRAVPFPHQGLDVRTTWSMRRNVRAVKSVNL